MSEPTALSFRSVAAAYDSGRPNYPAAAVTWALGEDTLDVLELGAGTGKLTRTLIGQGHRVLATDPLPEMLAILREQLDTPTAVARAEQLPIPSRSVDAVVCAQSFHWFEATPALAEITRVLRPGGRLVLVWNFRDLRVPWIQKLSDLIGVESRENLVDPVIGCPTFTDLEKAQFKSWQTHNAQSLIDLVCSRSAAATLPESERETLIKQVRELYDSYGRGPDGLQMPYTTHIYRAAVQTPAPTTSVPPPESNHPSAPGASPPPEDPGVVLIDFR